MSFSVRTDLASEARSFRLSDSASCGFLDGVFCSTGTVDGFFLERLIVDDDLAAEALCKPKGHYTTLSIDALLRREENGFERACRVVSSELSALLRLKEADRVLVVGLGNEAITPDALGPLCAAHTLVTRHLKAQLPDEFAPLRDVAVFCSGVLGTTGLESAELVRSVVSLCRPDAVIAVDALCAADPSRLCRTLQLTDAGIVPGSGVGNARSALTSDSVGVPVVAVGMPTVVDAASLCPDRSCSSPGLIVTPRDIDARVADAARLIGYSIDLALHPALTLADIDMLLS